MKFNHGVAGSVKVNSWYSHCAEFSNRHKQSITSIVVCYILEHKTLEVLR